MNIGETSPAMPVAWTKDIEGEALSHAIEAYPQEAVGIVEGGAYVRIDNRAAVPQDEVALSDDDLVRAANAEVFFHSHPDGRGCPSSADMIYQQQLAIPFVIAVVPHLDVFAFGDQLARRPLIGRGFRHGVHDCFSLMRDWYADHGVDVMNKPRDWEWWSRGGNLYLEFFEEAGFQLITPFEATRAGDVVLFKFRSEVPMHGALVTEDPQLLLHHAAGMREVDPSRLSATVPRSRYMHHATHALRPVHAP